MRSFRTAGQMGVLLLLAGAAAACERVNPGFKLKDTSDDQGEVTSLSTSSVSGPTVTGDTGMTATPTTSDETTFEATLTDATTTTTGAPTSETETTNDATTGGSVDFPPQCPNPIPGPWELAIADTFLTREPKGNPGCQGGGDGDTPCIDRDFSKALAYDIFHQTGNGPDEDFISVYAVRYGAPKVTYVDLPPELADYEGKPVKPQSWVAVRVKFTVFRPMDAFPWDPMDLRVVKFAAGDVWQDGEGEAFEPCVAPGASYRCLTCLAAGACENAWSSGQPYPFPAYPIQSLLEHPLQDNPETGATIEIELPIDALKTMNEPDGWLLTEGMMLVPKPEVIAHVVSVRALNPANTKDAPQFRVDYCNPTFMP